MLADHPMSAHFLTTNTTHQQMKTLIVIGGIASIPMAFIYTAVQINIVKYVMMMIWN